MRPLIAVTTSRRGGWRSFLMHRLALRRAGARAARLVPGRPVSIERYAGFIIGGGDDISAEHYDGAIVPDVRVDPERDRLELDLLQTILVDNVPVLGICRGAQMLNVALGGTLYTDIAADFPGTRHQWTVLPRKTIVVDRDSRLYALMRCGRCRVNALHHQSIRDLGAGLRVVARDGDGIVQAVEGTGATFRIGVQWHPELMIWSRAQQRLFQALVDATRAPRASPEPALEPRRGEAG